MLTVGAKAPDIRGTALDGRAFELRDDLSLILFFKSGCPACQIAWPFFNRLYEAYHPHGLEMLGISQHDAAKTREHTERYGRAFPLLIDEGLVFSRQYDPDFVPTAYLIDKDGRIVAANVSWHREQFEGLGAEIARRLGTRPQKLIEPGEPPVDFKPG